MSATIRRLLLTVLRLAVLGLPVRLLTVPGLVLWLLIWRLRLLLLVLIRALLRSLRGGRRRETGLRPLAHAADLVLHGLVLHRPLRGILDRRQRRRYRRVRRRAGFVGLRLVR